ncbi:aminotransferase-like domain-containing protein [Oceanithermus sp.]
MPDYRYAARTRRMENPIIRQLLRLGHREGVISLAGGIPAAETFPVAEIAEASRRALERWGSRALQYSPTEGLAPLREYIARRRGVRPEQVIVTSGSQQGLDLVGRVFLDEGDEVLVESPTYMGALQAWNPYDPRYLEVATDADGLVPEDLPEVSPKLTYVLPNFQNPTGSMLPAERRELVAAWARKHDTLLVEDDPYGHLYFDEEPPASLQKLCPDRVVYLGTFSKIVAPGLRLGYAIGPDEIINRLAQAKQAADLHSQAFGQAILSELAEMGIIERQEELTRQLYRRRAELLLGYLEQHLPRQVSWSPPKGGMFVWLTLPEGIDTLKLFESAIERGVAYVPGPVFSATGGLASSLRLTFVSVPEEQMEEGVVRLAAVLKEALEGLD